MQVLAFPAIFKADFSRFRPISAKSAADKSRYGRYGSILAESARFGANQSRFGTNRAASARIEPSWRESEKKKKKPDAVRRAGNCIGRRVPRRTVLDAGAAPLVSRPCFLDDN